MVCSDSVRGIIWGVDVTYRIKPLRTSLETIVAVLEHLSLNHVPRFLPVDATKSRKSLKSGGDEGIRTLETLPGLLP